MGFSFWEAQYPKFIGSTVPLFELWFCLVELILFISMKFCLRYGRVYCDISLVMAPPSMFAIYLKIGCTFDPLILYFRCVLFHMDTSEKWLRNC
jgi:hypothetical protein